MVSKLIEYVQQALAVLLAAVQAVEQPGSGAEKKAAAMAAAKVLIAALPIPAWLKTVLGLDAILSVLIDLIVATLNKAGWFEHTAQPAPS